MALFIIRNADVLKNCLDHILALPASKIWSVKISLNREKRSNSQNSYYWALCQILADWSGCSKDDMHDTLAIRFLGYETFEVDGKEYTRPVKTSRLTTEKFSEYLTTVKALALSLELKIPAPSYYGYEE